MLGANVNTEINADVNDDGMRSDVPVNANDLTETIEPAKSSASCEPRRDEEEERSAVKRSINQCSPGVTAQMEQEPSQSCTAPAAGDERDDNEEVLRTKRRAQNTRREELRKSRKLKQRAIDEGNRNDGIAEFEECNGGVDVLDIHADDAPSTCIGEHSHAAVANNALGTDVALGECDINSVFRDDAAITPALKRRRLVRKTSPNDWCS